MDDLISRQAVKELAHNQIREKYCGAALKEQRDFYIKLADSIIDLLPSVYNEPHWIPVEQELPEEDTDVLVTVHFLGLKRTHRNGWNAYIKESFYVEVASHINGEWSSASDEYKIAKDRHKVVAWMPLPEPYKGVTT